MKINCYKYFNTTTHKKAWLLLALLPAISCSKLIEIDAPINSVGTEKVFQTDAKAEAALAALYTTMINTTEFNTLCYGGVSLTGSLLSDEVRPSMGTLDVVYNPFQFNKVLKENEALMLLWKDGYKYIYIANTLMEGIAASASPTLSESTRRQIRGEALLIRSWTHFQLMNLFGPIPLVLTSDVNQTRAMERSKPEAVYQQLEADLKEAYELLQPDFRVTGGQRIRPSRDAATGLLARMYLYQNRWAEAEAEATKLISNGAYVLEPLNKTFRGTSLEPVWQLKRTDYGVNDIKLMESINFMPKLRFSVVPDAPYMWKDKSIYEIMGLEVGFLVPAYPVSEELLAAFEPNDNRKTKWLDSIPQPDEAPYNGKTLYCMTKYENEFNLTEKADLHLAMQRIAEIYLIRAEARAQQATDLTGAAQDLDAVRGRAGLLPTTATTQSALLDAIARERRVELFGEWGHRWFDLKRTGKAAAMASAHPEKLPWSNDKLVLPIPIKEVEINPSLGQNPGY